MAKLADAADLKSADPKGLWGFKSPSRHHGDNAVIGAGSVLTRDVVAGEMVAGNPARLLRNR